MKPHAQATFGLRSCSLQQLTFLQTQRLKELSCGSLNENSLKRMGTGQIVSIFSKTCKKGCNLYPLLMLGSGIVKGLVETARNFAGSYASEERMVTVQYPEERAPAKEAARQFPFLVFDGDDAQAGLRCVACQICEKECPPQCIYIEKSKDKKPDYVGKPQFYPATFDIDISVCMSCQICVEVCPFEAIKMDQEYELSNNDRFEALLIRKDRLAKPNSYYHKIHPTEATEVDERLAAEKAKAAAKAKADAEAKAKAAAEAKSKAAAGVVDAAPSPSPGQPVPKPGAPATPVTTPPSPAS
jgi:NADH-quinone oxidoreductase subunit I